MHLYAQFHLAIVLCQSYFLLILLYKVDKHCNDIIMGVFVYRIFLTSILLYAVEKPHRSRPPEDLRHYFCSQLSQQETFIHSLKLTPSLN